MNVEYRAKSLALRLRIWAEDLRTNLTGQDLIEYALMAAFLAVATAALLPAVATNISKIFGQVGSVLLNAKATGN